MEVAWVDLYVVFDEVREHVFRGPSCKRTAPPLAGLQLVERASREQMHLAGPGLRGAEAEIDTVGAELALLRRERGEKGIAGQRVRNGAEVLFADRAGLHALPDTDVRLDPMQVPPLDRKSTRL